jgi:DNA-binding XRE family transcriptional regulator
MPAASATIPTASATPVPAGAVPIPAGFARVLTPLASAAEARPARPQTTVLDGQRLREARRQRGLSQERLAHQSGMSPATVARLERQRRPRCRPRTLARLAAALDVRPAAITPALGAAPDPAGPVPSPAVPSPAVPSPAVPSPAAPDPAVPGSTPAAAGPRPVASALDSILTGAGELTGCLLTCARLSAEFGSYYIRAERSHYRRRPHYIATARQLDTRPYAIVTPDPAELRAQLIAAQPAARRPPSRS